MAILISVNVKGQTQQGYDAALAALSNAMKKAPGFIIHCAHPVEDGWQLTEVWETKAHSDQWFVQHVAPHLPKDIHPKRSYYELHTVVTPIE